MIGEEMGQEMDDDPLEALKRRKAPDAEPDPLMELKKRKAARNPTVAPIMAPRESTAARPRPKDSTLSPLAGLAPIAQGLTLGAADEILGAFEGADQALHGGSFKKGYVEGRDKVRAGGKQFAEEHPVASPVLTVAGGIAPAFLGPGAALIKAGTPLLARLGLGALEGAAIGGVSGALSADEDRTAGAVQGAAIGGVLGGALPVAGAGVNAARNIIGRRGAAAGAHANALVTRALERDQVTPQSLRSPMAGKPVILPDLAGENTMGLARGAQATPSEAKERLAEFLNQRQAGQPERVLGNLEHAAGRQNENVHDVAEKLIERTRTNAQPLYEKVNDAIVDDPEVIALIHGSPYFRRAHELGRRLAKEEGIDLPPLVREVEIDGKMVKEQVPQTVRAINYTKRGLDAVIERGYRKGNMDASLARALKNKKNTMLSRVDEQHPDFKAARAQFAGDKEMEEALASGRDFLKEDYRVTQKQLSGMTEGEREMHKVGALDAVRRVMDEAPDGADVVKRIFGNPRKRDQLKVLLGDEPFARLEQQLGVESRMVRTKDRVTGGSPTARIQTELAELTDTPAMQLGEAIVRGNPKTAALRAVFNAAKQRGAGNVGQVANEVSQRMMLTPGTPQYTAWLRVMERMQQDAVKTSLPRTVARRALIAGASNRE